MYRTPNGAILYPTNLDGSFKKRDDYLLCQMHPIVPQRLEWVREDHVIHGQSNEA